MPDSWGDASPSTCRPMADRSPLRVFEQHKQTRELTPLTRLPPGRVPRGVVSRWNLRWPATRMPALFTGTGRSTTRRLRPLDPCLPQLKGNDAGRGSRLSGVLVDQQRTGVGGSGRFSAWLLIEWGFHFGAVGLRIPWMLCPAWRHAPRYGSPGPPTAPKWKPHHLLMDGERGAAESADPEPLADPAPPPATRHWPPSAAPSPDAYAASSPAKSALTIGRFSRCRGQCRAVRPCLASVESLG